MNCKSVVIQSKSINAKKGKVNYHAKEMSINRKDKVIIDWVAKQSTTSCARIDSTNEDENSAFVEINNKLKLIEDMLNAAMNALLC